MSEFFRFFFVPDDSMNICVFMTIKFTFIHFSWCLLPTEKFCWFIQETSNEFFFFFIELVCFYFFVFNFFFHLILVQCIFTLTSQCQFSIYYFCINIYGYVTLVSNILCQFIWKIFKNWFQIEFYGRIFFKCLFLINSSVLILRIGLN